MHFLECSLVYARFVVHYIILYFPLKFAWIIKVWNGLGTTLRKVFSLMDPKTVQGLYSLSGLTARSREVSNPKIPVNTFPIARKLDRHLGSSAAQTAVKFQSVAIIITHNFTASRFGDKTAHRFVNRGPVYVRN